MHQLRYMRFIRSTFFALAFVYITFHALHGGQGLYALLKENHKLTQLQLQLAEASAERSKLEKRVTLMRNDSLDTDMLEEQARRLLGTTAPDEVVVFPGS